MTTTLANVELSPFVTDQNQNRYQAKPMLSGEMIQGRVQALGSELAERYAERGEVHLITVLNGALRFATDLRRSMQAANPDLVITSDEVKVASYQGTQSTGELRLESKPTTDLGGKDVLVLEDIFDSGFTLKKLIDFFQLQNPASMEIAVAVNKNNPKRPADLLSSIVMHTGFRIPNEFVIGYGMDLDQEYRDLQSIYTLTPVEG